ncbi:type II toxin-antitoxin system RatA family toxin [Magnetococcales bacterium HHB-1]
MPRIRLSEVIPYPPAKVYDLVVDVESYPEFLPWCVRTRKFAETPEQFIAELTVSFKGVRQSFQTVDRIVPNQSVDIRLRSGPFTRLISAWHFTSVEENATRIDFSIDFEFKSRLLNMTIGPLFTHAAKQMVSAFRSRAHALYRGNQRI